MKHTEIHDYILRNIERHPTDIAILLSEQFKISRQRAHFYLAREVTNGTLIKTGKTRGSKYYLTEGNYIAFDEKIRKGLADDFVWTRYVKRMITKLSKNVQSIAFYGFTEIYNNAIEHSKGKKIFTMVRIKEDVLEINILDDGIGILKKIQKSLGLTSSRESILHLSKGKFTTDPKNHTGQGIFFTSRMVDSFSLFANDLYYQFENNEWFLSREKETEVEDGTLVRMRIKLNTKKTPKEIFDQYADLETGFSKTKVAVALSNDPNDPHVSRSQAKRLLMGLEKFKTIVLDFKSVPMVGQAFVDEVFRVFKNEHPDSKIMYTNASKEVAEMIKINAPDAESI